MWVCLVRLLNSFHCIPSESFVITYIVTSRKKGIREELKQTKPFFSTAQEAFLSIQRTADALSQKVEQFLKPWGISGTQYNVLRILRGAGPEGLRCGEIGERMVAHDPDITRLLDRMEKAGWIERARDEGDRRVVLTHINRRGLDLLKQIDKPLEEFTHELGKHIAEKRFRELIDILDEIRNSPETSG
jgi:DNA-binding MarR family transcriptional regulator